MSDTLIKVEGVSKKFCRSLKKSLWYGVQDLGNEIRGRRHGGKGELRADEFWAIRDVSFQVGRGECLGMIGKNGAGKSTLLKILTGLIKPDEGQVTLRGRIGSLIELGGGFNPLLSGRENIYIGGAIYGLSRAEMNAKIDEIISFSGIEEFINTPFGKYSSGMKVRLGFAVATHIDPDVLFLDEVLAVGDAGFRVKSYNKMKELIQKSAVIFVSHAMPLVARASTSVMLLNQGAVAYHGDSISHGIERYMDMFEGEKPEAAYCEGAVIDSAHVRSTHCRSSDDNEVVAIHHLDDLVLDLNLTVNEPCREFSIAFSIADKDMRSVAAFSTTHNGVRLINKGGALNLAIRIPECQLTDGEYFITILVSDSSPETIGINGMPSRLAEYRHWVKFKVRGLNSKHWVPFFLKGFVDVKEPE
ncbi:MAG: ATP-binding cassette domain-containing protein [Thiocapsa sp.]|uniref:ABC transporter ATP-binding protein n=1 Tax=Thiocapsa sp. TaxID=2024551 RepID=UPI001BCC9175|nr:ABC transporter ATP-binding protein [Thiocapsa sp.]QVL50135.1 MAG: ATP-binding cassette domain-containing protein [Thiocapsa sp.]